MSRSHAALLLLTAACGRVAFDPLANVAADAADDTLLSSTCPVAVVASDPLQISGVTIEYTSFQNASTPVPGVTIDALDANGGLIDTVISDAAGVYSLGVATGGVPRVATVYAVAAGYFKTVIEADRPFASDTNGAGLALWSLGDIPLWTGTGVGQVYSTAGVVRDTARGTLNVAVRDCDGNALDGVTVTIDPAPGAARYQGADGRPSTTLITTEAPFAHVLAFNAVAGTTTITASKAGVVFAPVTVVVEPRAGQHADADPRLRAVTARNVVGATRGDGRLRG